MKASPRSALLRQYHLSVLTTAAVWAFKANIPIFVSLNKQLPLSRKTSNKQAEANNTCPLTVLEKAHDRCQRSVWRLNLSSSSSCPSTTQQIVSIGEQTIAGDKTNCRRIAGRQLLASDIVSAFSVSCQFTLRLDDCWQKKNFGCIIYRRQNLCLAKLVRHTDSIFLLLT